jgi:MinD superfamily P-loop ATPase
METHQGGEKMKSEKIKQITVLSGKGGTGKTTLTAALAQLSSPISLMADCDVDAPNLHLLLKPENTSSERFLSGKLAIKDPQRCIDCGKCLKVCKFDAINENFEINPLKCEGCGACAWICPEKAIKMEIQHSGSIYESKTRFGPLVHASLDIGAENSGKLVSEVIQKGQTIAKRLKKEIVIVDGSPGIGCPVIASLTNAELVIIVVEPTITAIHDMKRVIELLQFFKLPPAIVINKSTINEEQRIEIHLFCENQGIPIIGEVSYNLKIYKAMVKGETVLEHGINELHEPLNEMWLKIQELLHL